MSESAVRIAIVGAGISGLSCALRVQELGGSPVLIDANSRVGGRVATEPSHGFLIDRGFAILLVAYPEARRLLDYERLRLRRFEPGALVWDGRAFRLVPHPLRRPLAAVRAVLSGVVGVRDAAAVLPLAIRAVLRRPAFPRVAGRSVADTIARGMRPTFVESFLRSFFGGVFLDRSLGTDLGQLEFCLSMFAAGAAAVPSGGMAEIPRQMAADLPPGSFRLGSRAVAVDGQGVTLADGGREPADAVVVATEMDECGRLLGETTSARPWQSTAMLAFDLPAEEAGRGILLLDGTGEGPINHACFISSVAPNYAPSGRAILYANVVDPEALALGDPDLAARARAQLARWFPTSRVSDWSLRRVVRIARALPRQHPEDLASPRPTQVAPRLFRCGDHLADGSLNGAMRSGRLAADAAVAAARGARS